MTDTSLSSIWTLTNGMAGFEVQTSAIAQALVEKLCLPQNIITRKTVSLSAPYKWLAPYGPAQPTPECAPPYPDLLIASGRKTIPLARYIRRASAGSCFTVILQNPRLSPRHFDFIWAPQHDSLKGSNVMSTLLSPHGLDTGNLEEAASLWNKKMQAQTGQKRIGVLVGGPNKIYNFGNQDVDALVQSLTKLAEAGHYLMISLSRRTPERVAAQLRQQMLPYKHFLWAPDQGGDNPYRGIIGLADALLVTCDSVNMVGEACITGAPVYVFPLQGGSTRFHTFHQAVCRTGHATPLNAKELAGLCSAPFPQRKDSGLNSTPEIAGKIADALRKR